MSDLISRETTLNVLKERYCEGCTYYGVRCKSVLAGNCPIYNVIIAVDAVQAVDAEIVRHGKWKSMGDCGVTECSACEWNTEEYVGDYKYCPCCGAKMDADERTQIAS